MTADGGDLGRRWCLEQAGRGGGRQLAVTNEGWWSNKLVVRNRFFPGLVEIDRSGPEQSKGLSASPSALPAVVYLDLVGSGGVYLVDSLYLFWRPWEDIDNGCETFIEVTV
ncbi:hypothetical protein KFK09_002656 [Dendrobium nobile]|uniref:Uncharacterized protein n=1 Tax=Dendrobium nobile TaxID=94219 RepID=A0A8T3C6Z6_DENNO|nr:hypothetical protein KFK09_002656 [Dendrobium nobile]